MSGEYLFDDLAKTCRAILEVTCVGETMEFNYDRDFGIFKRLVIVLDNLLKVGLKTRKGPFLTRTTKDVLQEVGAEKLWGLLQQLGLKQDTRTFIAFGLVQKRMHVYLAAVPPSLYELTAPVIQHAAEITSLLASLSVLKFNPGTNGGLQRVSTVTWDDLPSDTSHMLYILPFKLPATTDPVMSSLGVVPSPGTSEGSRPTTPAEAVRPITPSSAPATEARDVNRLAPPEPQGSLISFSPPASSFIPPSAPEHSFYPLFACQPLTPSPAPSPTPADAASPQNAATSERLRQEALRREQQRREEQARQDRLQLQEEERQHEAQQREAARREAEAAQAAAAAAAEAVPTNGHAVDPPSSDESKVGPPVVELASETPEIVPEATVARPQDPVITFAVRDPVASPEPVQEPDPSPVLLDVYASSVVVPPTDTVFDPLLLLNPRADPVPSTPAEPTATPFFDLSVLAAPPALSQPSNSAELAKLKKEIKELKQLVRTKSEAQESSEKETKRERERAAKLEAIAREDAATIASMQAQLTESKHNEGKSRALLVETKNDFVRQREELQAQLENGRTSAAADQLEISSLRSALAAAEGKLAEAAENSQSLEKSGAEWRRQCEVETERSVTLEEEAGRLTAELEAARDLQGLLERQVSETNTLFEDERQRSLQRQTALEKAEARLTETSKLLFEARAQASGLEREVGEQKARTQALEKEVASLCLLQDQLDKAKTALAQSEGEYARLHEKMETYEMTIEALKTQIEHMSESQSQLQGFYFTQPAT